MVEAGSRGGPTIPILSEPFDQIGCGTVILSVPLCDDIIQIGARDMPDRGALRVLKRRGAATVERTDGKSIQVAILRQLDTPAAAAVSLVFRQPIPALLLRRRQGGWTAAVNPHNLTEPGHLKQFLDTIGAFGSAKQCKSPVVSDFPMRLRQFR
ncbi:MULTISPECIES: hypothetical protein [unclassified Mycolicibacterium]|uniref:hypothetical protein n=1 Tax=unclassified Mycolicibacterium TaxID=2636767 RepID=UPI002EDA4DE5